MDWNLAIEKNTTALKRVVAMLVAMTGLASESPSPLWGGVRGGGGCQGATPTRPSDDGRPPHKGEVDQRPTLPRRLHRAVLRLLRPAESAVRRLIVVAARGLVLPPLPPRPARPRPKTSFTRNGKGTGIVLPQDVRSPPTSRTVSLPLLDPLKQPFQPQRSSSSGVPRISVPGQTRLFAVKPRRRPSPEDRLPDDPLDATRLAQRLAALTAALDDLPRQARRFARWRANREAARARGKIVVRTGAKIRFCRNSPLRPGLPPGAIRRPKHEVHALLNDLHELAFDALLYPDTS